MAKRDNFSPKVKDQLAKRVGMSCSNPDCRLPTAGPASGEGITNIGIAAHIHAALEGGARFKEEQSNVDRSSFSNGIWLCMPCSKIIDDDEYQYTEYMLRGWKDTSEKIASLETLGYRISKGRSFASLEKKMPELLKEMRADISKESFVRRFFVRSRQYGYGGTGNEKVFIYYTEDHTDLYNKLVIAVNYNAIIDISTSKIEKYEFTENFVEFLQGPE